LPAPDIGAHFVNLAISNAAWLTDDYFVTHTFFVPTILSGNADQLIILLKLPMFQLAANIFWLWDIANAPLDRHKVSCIECLPGTGNIDLFGQLLMQVCNLIID
jgi:hypothetical protein